MAITTYQGRVVIRETGMAQVLGEDQELTWLVIVCEEHNREPLRVGGSTVTRDKSSTDGPPIKAGRERVIPYCNIGTTYLNGVAGDAAHWLGVYKTGAISERVLLERILEQLKNMNTQLSLVTDEEPKGE